MDGADAGGGAEAAEEAGLRYVSDEQPGVTRHRHGRGFTYRNPDGSTVTDAKVRRRIQELAIPPAWTDVWICRSPNGHILATGRDGRGRKQYLYHPAWRELRDAHKFDQLAAFGHALPDLRSTIEANLHRRFSRTKVLSLVVRLLDETLIRIGNAEYTEANHSYGLTTLSPDHVELTPGTIAFEFVGKSGLSRELRVADAELAGLVRDCHELGGHELFCYKTGRGPDAPVASVTSTDVNEFLREHMGPGVTAKSFRTWGATKVMVAALAISPVPEPADGPIAEKEVLAAYDVVAANLGDTRAVARASYVHPVVPEAFRSGDLHEAWRSSRTTKTMDRAERTLLRLLEP